MGERTITDWMSAISGALLMLVTAPAAVYAAIYTKRAADAGAKAAAEAANQVKELQALREPRAVITLRVPEPFDNEQYLKYGLGHYCPANEFWHGENSCLY